MKTHLLDVNVLFALAWPKHGDHAAAQSWFQHSGARSWSTNPLTQLGLLRLLTNSALTGGAVSAEDALDTLDQATSQTGHEFWAMASYIGEVLQPVVPRIRGHRQWTDAYLLQAAVERGGIFVTFDAGVKELTTRESSAHLLLLKNR